MACRSMICNRKHFVLSNNDNNDIIHYSEFFKNRYLSCRGAARNMSRLWCLPRMQKFNKNY